jgi:hypothetical protein
MQALNQLPPIFLFLFVNTPSMIGAAGLGGGIKDLFLPKEPNGKDKNMLMGLLFFLGAIPFNYAFLIHEGHLFYSQLCYICSAAVFILFFIFHRNKKVKIKSQALFALLFSGSFAAIVIALIPFLYQRALTFHVSTATWIGGSLVMLMGFTVTFSFTWRSLTALWHGRTFDQEVKAQEKSVNKILAEREKKSRKAKAN